MFIDNDEVELHVPFCFNYSGHLGLSIFRADLFTSFGIMFSLCRRDPRDLFAKRTTFSVTSLTRNWGSEERTEQTDRDWTRLDSVYVCV